MANIGDTSLYPVRRRREYVKLQLIVLLGTGAVAATFGDTDLVTITRTGAGTYNLTFPKLPAATFALASINVGTISSPAATIAGALITASALDAGTATIRTYLATPGTAVDGASGDGFIVSWEGPLTGVSP